MNEKAKELEMKLYLNENCPGCWLKYPPIGLKNLKIHNFKYF